MNRKLLFLCFSVLVNGVFVFVILFCLGGIFLSSSKISVTSLVNMKTYGYQYYERNIEASTDHFGWISIPKIINKNDFISYKDDYGSEFLISNFGDEEYECTGSCHCDDHERRTSFPVVSRGISYLLVSVSSFVAYEKAKTYFESKCKEELAPACHRKWYIQATVEECSPIIEKTNERTSGNDNDQRTYFCYGNCVKNFNIGRNFKNEKNPSPAPSIDSGTSTFLEEVNCETLKQEGEVEVEERDILPSLLKAQNRETSEKYHYTALMRFQERYLTNFCKENSQVDYVYEWGNSRNGERVYSREQKRRGSACVGRSNFQGGKSNAMKNVHCRQIRPKPTSPNSEYYDRQFWEKKQKLEKGETLHEMKKY